MSLMWVWTRHSKAHMADVTGTGHCSYASPMCHNALGKLDGSWSGKSKAMVASGFVPNGFCRMCQRIEQEVRRDD